MPGVVCVLTAADLADIDPYWGHAIKRPAGRRDRPGALRGRARRGGRSRGRGYRCGGPRAHRGRLRGARGRRHDRAGARAGRAAGQRRSAAPRALPRPRRAGPGRGQRLLPLPHRSRRGRGGLRARRHRRRGRVHVPGRLPVRDGDAHRRRAGRGGRDHAVGLLPASVPRPRRDRRALPGADRERPHRRPLPRRRLRLQVVHEDGADRGRARAQGRPARAHPEPGRRIDGDDAPPRHALPHAHGDERARAGCSAARSSAGSTRARTRTTARA